MLDMDSGSVRPSAARKTCWSSELDVPEDESPITVGNGLQCSARRDLRPESPSPDIGLRMLAGTTRPGFQRNHILGGWMKRLAWILVLPVLTCSLGHAESSASATASPDSGREERMFFPRDMFWGWAQFDLAPPHNEIDPNICAGNAGQYGGVNAPCSMFARYMLSGMLEVRPFGSGELRRFMLFGAPSFLFGKTIPQTLYTWSPDAIGIEHSWGSRNLYRQGIRVSRDSALPLRSAGRARHQSWAPRTWATTAPGAATSPSVCAKSFGTRRW